MSIKTAVEGYIIINSLPHYGEKAVPTGKVEENRAEFILLNCTHSETRVWLERKDIS